MVKASDLIKEQMDRKKNKEKIFDKIYNRIENKVIKASKNNFYECYYEIPEFILNIPLYDFNDCKYYVLQKLIKNELYKYAPSGRPIISILSQPGVNESVNPVIVHLNGITLTPSTPSSK